MENKTKPTMTLRFTVYMLQERLMQLNIDDTIVLSLLDELEQEMTDLDKKIYSAYNIDMDALE